MVFPRSASGSSVQNVVSQLFSRDLHRIISKAAGGLPPIFGGHQSQTGGTAPLLTEIGDDALLSTDDSLITDSFSTSSAVPPSSDALAVKNPSKTDSNVFDDILLEVIIAETANDTHSLSRECQHEEKTGISDFPGDRKKIADPTKLCKGSESGDTEASSKLGKCQLVAKQKNEKNNVNDESSACSVPESQRVPAVFSVQQREGQLLTCSYEQKLLGKKRSSSSDCLPLQCSYSVARSSAAVSPKEYSLFSSVASDSRISRGSGAAAAAAQRGSASLPAASAAFSALTASQENVGKTLTAVASQQRERFSPALSCCSLTSSPSASTLLPAAALMLRPSRQEHKHLMREVVLREAEDEVIGLSAAGSSRCCANTPTRLEEVESKWFFVDILSDAASISGLHEFSSAALPRGRDSKSKQQCQLQQQQKLSSSNFLCNSLISSAVVVPPLRSNESLGSSTLLAEEKAGSLLASSFSSNGVGEDASAREKAVDEGENAASPADNLSKAEAAMGGHLPAADMNDSSRSKQQKQQLTICEATEEKTDQTRYDRQQQQQASIGAEEGGKTADALVALPLEEEAPLSAEEKLMFAIRRNNSSDKSLSNTSKMRAIHPYPYSDVTAGISLCQSGLQSQQRLQQQARNTEGSDTEGGIQLLSSESSVRSRDDYADGAHRMHTSEGSTCFSSLEEMINFIRSSVSLYGGAAVEGVTFYVPSADAEKLVLALEEALPYTWRDIRSAALAALQPLTAIVIGRFILVQLSALLSDFAIAETAAAAATAAAEASVVSAALTVAPWLIAFGGCVFAMVRGTRALHASRRAHFNIYETVPVSALPTRTSAALTATSPVTLTTEDNALLASARAALLTGAATEAKALSADTSTAMTQLIAAAPASVGVTAASVESESSARTAVSTASTSTRTALFAMSNEALLAAGNGEAKRAEKHSWRDAHATLTTKIDISTIRLGPADTGAAEAAAMKAAST